MLIDSFFFCSLFLNQLKKLIIYHYIVKIDSKNNFTSCIEHYPDKIFMIKFFLAYVEIFNELKFLLEFDDLLSE